ncbi:hypothetical protein TKK_0007706 [Trichogramma kaykai]|uniref:Uncharacterized protein n=1 Tax=Trichogramma kaykai TaxID=54128 RepID=A0ABD2X7L9_9HYME
MENENLNDIGRAQLESVGTPWNYSDEKWHRGCYYLYHNFRDWTIRDNIPCLTFNHIFTEYMWLQAISPTSDRSNENAKSIRKYMMLDKDKLFFYKSFERIQNAALKNIPFNEIQPLLPPWNCWEWFNFVLPHYDEIVDLYNEAYPVYRKYGENVDHRAIIEEEREMYCVAEYIIEEHIRKGKQKPPSALSTLINNGENFKRLVNTLRGRIYMSDLLHWIAHDHNCFRMPNMTKEELALYHPHYKVLTCVAPLMSPFHGLAAAYENFDYIVENSPMKDDVVAFTKILKTYSPKDEFFLKANSYIELLQRCK